MTTTRKSPSLLGQNSWIIPGKRIFVEISDQTHLGGGRPIDPFRHQRECTAPFPQRSDRRRCATRTNAVRGMGYSLACISSICRRLSLKKEYVFTLGNSRPPQYSSSAEDWAHALEVTGAMAKTPDQSVAGSHRQITVVAAEEIDLAVRNSGFGRLLHEPPMPFIRAVVFVDVDVKHRGRLQFSTQRHRSQ